MLKAHGGASSAIAFKCVDSMHYPVHHLEHLIGDMALRFLQNVGYATKAVPRECTTTVDVPPTRLEFQVAELKPPGCHRCKSPTPASQLNLLG